MDLRIFTTWCGSFSSGGNPSFKDYLNILVLVCDDGFIFDLTSFSSYTFISEKLSHLSNDMYSAWVDNRAIHHTELYKSNQELKGPIWAWTSIITLFLGSSLDHKPSRQPWKFSHNRN